MVAFNTVARGQFCCFVLLACCITASNVASNAPPPFTQFLEENNVPDAVSTALTQYKVEAGNLSQHALRYAA